MVGCRVWLWGTKEHENPLNPPLKKGGDKVTQNNSPPFSKEGEKVTKNSPPFFKGGQGGLRVFSDENRKYDFTCKFLRKHTAQHA